MGKEIKGSPKKKQAQAPVQRESRNVCARVTVSAWLKASRVKWNNINKKENPGF